jgi:phospholipid-binding lipoprotein MlaA
MARTRADHASETLALLIALAFAAWLALGCAHAPAEPVMYDRLPTNRPVFAGNDAFDEYLMGPVARGWIAITPAVARRSISRAYHNLTFPGRLVSHVLQGSPMRATTETGRFVVNTTAGVAGLADVASMLGIPSHDSDMGKTFARWGLPPGDYVMVPLVGPFHLRDLAGGVADLLLNPLTYAPPAAMPLDVLFAVNGRAQMEREIQALRRAALDRYAATRDAYEQRRAAPEE